MALQAITVDLSELLLAAEKSGRVRHVRAFLDAGGSARALVNMKLLGDNNFDVYQVPLTMGVIFNSKHPHTELEASLRLLIAAGADIDELSAESTHTAFTAALGRTCCLKPLEIMLKLGARIKRKDQTTGMTAISMAAAAGLVPACKLLLNAAANYDYLNPAEKAGNYALSWASREGQVGVMKMLLERTVDVNWSDAEVWSGWSPLHLASTHGHLAAVKLLLRSGADVNAVNPDQRTALDLALRVGHIQVVSLLLARRASVATKDRSGSSLLFAAVLSGKLQLVRLITQRGVSVKEDVDAYGSTLLTTAASCGFLDIAKWLIQQWPAGVSAADNTGITALHSAASQGHSDIVELLLNNNADIDAVNVDGNTALSAAVFHKFHKCTQVLLDAGADVNHMNNLNTSCLHIASSHGDAKLAQTLIDNGAGASMGSVVCDCACCGMLTEVSICSDAATLKVLLASGGADYIMNINERGNTCLHAAAQHHRPLSVICLLIQAGADVRVVNHEGRTAAGIAQLKGFTIIEKLLNRVVQ